jgi:tetratricopeptide (TPR) repeat protein
MSYWPCIITIFLCSLLPASLAAQDTLSIATGYEVNGDHEAALAAYSLLLDEISSEKGEFAIDLIEPLMGLSRGYIATESPVLAEETLRRAQHIAHRNEGVYSPKQFEAIELMTRIALDSNDPLQADKQQQFLFFLGTHNFDGLEVLPVYIRYSEWFMQTGQYRRARKILEEAIALVLQTSTEQDLRQLEPLRLLAKTRRLQGTCCGEKSLEKALEIISKNDTIAGDLRSEAYFELADAYTLRGKTDEAARFYLLAWQAVNDGTDPAPKMIAMSGKLNAARRRPKKSYRVERDVFAGYNQLRRMSIDEELAPEYQVPQLFLVPLDERGYDIKIRDAMQTVNTQEKTEKMIGTPFQFVLRQIQNLLPRSLKHEASLANISIGLDFTVTDKGTIRDVEFTRSNAPVKLNRLMEEVIKKARFRPALVDGHPVTTQNVSITQSFAPNYSRE